MVGARSNEKTDDGCCDVYLYKCCQNTDTESRVVTAMTLLNKNCFNTKAIYRRHWYWEGQTVRGLIYTVSIPLEDR